MKNIGKPCAGKPHARFDEGGQVKTCYLLYPLIFRHINSGIIVNLEVAKRIHQFLDAQIRELEKIAIK